MRITLFLFENEVLVIKPCRRLQEGMLEKTNQQLTFTYKYFKDLAERGALYNKYNNKAETDDPDAYGSERLVIENAWFNELTLQKFENAKMIDEEYSGGFTDYYFPDLVKVR